eukprot:scaffold2462_cov127-Cylindrotheca_fusiformis.AAC.6
MNSIAALLGFASLLAFVDVPISRPWSSRAFIYSLNRYLHHNTQATKVPVHSFKASVLQRLSLPAALFSRLLNPPFDDKVL